MVRRMWVYDPQSGGKTIPEAIKPRIRQRIIDHAETYYSGRYNRIDVRSRGSSVTSMPILSRLFRQTTIRNSTGNFAVPGRTTVNA